MTDPARGFKRMIVGLPQSMIDLAAVDAAADLAEFLNIELLATFVADSSLHALAGFPRARELRIVEQGWQAIDLEQITRDLEQATSAARRRFAESVRSRAIKTSFDVIAGTEAMTSLIRADDIVAIIEPSHPGERITRQFAGLLDAALAAAGAVLILPRRLARTTGPVMAIADGGAEAGIGIALEIAVALKEDLVVATQRGAPLPAELLARAHDLGVRIEQIRAGGSIAAAAMPTPVLSQVRERLRVVTRSQVPDDAARLFTGLQGVPLLVVEPDRLELGGRPPHAATA